MQAFDSKYFISNEKHRYDRRYKALARKGRTMIITIIVADN
ncbi:hypothetical protein PCH70_27120 [Pseudomonas cichorii JBC1]|nr:hypothetical protein PCH70_27120 [Pseudomonas cichorii JBC1]